MDTLIYIYRNREQKTYGHGAGEGFRVEKVKTRRGCLIYLGLPGEMWRVQKKEQNSGQESEEEQSKVSRYVETPRREKRKRKCLWRRENRRGRKKKEGKGKAENPDMGLYEELSGLQTALALLADESGDILCMYEDFLQKTLAKTPWGRYWSIQAFAGFREREWMELLMPYATCDRFILLGVGDRMGSLLCGAARGMRSVQWILEAAQYTESVQRFEEEFAEEYGLVIELSLLAEGARWQELCLESAVPANVLDFTKEERMSGGKLPAGSVWIDMDSLDEKRRRMEGLAGNLKYVSLKKWLGQQKNQDKSRQI